MGVGDQVHFLGPKPFPELDNYLVEADILVAPRIKGVNTQENISLYAFRKAGFNDQVVVYPIPR